jgi:hypothetical protein
VCPRSSSLCESVSVLNSLYFIGPSVAGIFLQRAVNIQAIDHAFDGLKKWDIYKMALEQMRDRQIEEAVRAETEKGVND